MRAQFLGIILIGITFVTCEKSDSDSPSLIYTTSFETGSALVDDGWTGWYALAADGIASGGDSCLLLQPQWVPSTGQIEKAIELPAADATYELVFWTKSENWVGNAYLIRRSSDSDTPLYNEVLDADDWEERRLTFTPDLAADEVLVILFSAGGTEVASGNVYIDELSLHQLVD